MNRVYLSPAESARMRADAQATHARFNPQTGTHADSVKPAPSSSKTVRTGPPWTETPKGETPAYASIGEWCASLPSLSFDEACGSYPLVYVVAAPEAPAHIASVYRVAAPYPLPQHRPHDERTPRQFGIRKPLDFTGRVSSTGPAVPYHQETHGTVADWQSVDRHPTHFFHVEAGETFPIGRAWTDLPDHAYGFRRTTR